MSTNKAFAIGGDAGPRSGRLMDLHQASLYTGIPYWTLRRLATSGAVPVVQLRQNGKTIRRILFDKADLDRYIDGCKERRME